MARVRPGRGFSKLFYRHLLNSYANTTFFYPFNKAWLLRIILHRGHIVAGSSLCGDKDGMGANGEAYFSDSIAYICL